MSRNIADYLYEEIQFDEEYKKNFSDKIIEVDENEVKKEEYRQLEEYRQQMKMEEEYQKYFDMFYNMKSDLNEYGICSKLNYIQFLKLIRKTDLIKHTNK